jgi:hypothetical protein
MVTERRIPVDATLAAHYLATTYRVRILPSTIRQWAKRGHINRYTGHLRYDLREVERYARKRGLLDRR